MPLRTLQKPWQFERVYRNGKKIDCKYAVLFYHRTGDPAAGPSFGFVASKRVGNAVKRNRAKRLLREVAKDVGERLLQRDLWIVLVARSGIIETKSQGLLAELDQKLVGEGLIAPPSD
jgi:ribonuclease P protein component